MPWARGKRQKQCGLRRKSPLGLSKSKDHSASARTATVAFQVRNNVSTRELAVGGSRRSAAGAGAKLAEAGSGARGG